jgi:hypothetical protein
MIRCALKRLERDDRPGVHNARNGLDLLVDEMADVSAVLDVELHQQIVVASGRVDFGRDLGIGKRVGDRVGSAEVAFDLNKKRDHAFLLAAGGALAIQQNRGALTSRQNILSQQVSHPIGGSGCV